MWVFTRGFVNTVLKYGQNNKAKWKIKTKNGFTFYISCFCSTLIIYTQIESNILLVCLAQRHVNMWKGYRYFPQVGY